MDNTGIVLPNDITEEFDRIGICFTNIITSLSLIRRYWQDREHFVDQLTQRARNAKYNFQNLRVQSEHDNQMFRQALNDEGEARRKNWELVQDLRAYAQSMVTRKQNRINVLSQEKIIL